MIRAAALCLSFVIGPGPRELVVAGDVPDACLMQTSLHEGTTRAGLPLAFDHDYGLAGACCTQAAEATDAGALAGAGEFRDAAARAAIRDTIATATRSTAHDESVAVVGVVGLGDGGHGREQLSLSWPSTATAAARNASSGSDSDDMLLSSFYAALDGPLVARPLYIYDAMAPTGHGV